MADPVESFSRLKAIPPEVNQQLLHTIAKSCDALYTLDKEWRFTYLNATAETAMAIKREDLLGKTLWEIFPRVAGTEIEERLHQAMSQQAPVSFETVAPTYKINIAIQAYPSPQGLTVFFRDITQRKLVQDTIERQNLILKAINRIYEDTFQCATPAEAGKACLAIVESVTRSQFGFIGDINANGLSHNIAVSGPEWGLYQMPEQTVQHCNPDTFLTEWHGREVMQGMSVIIDSSTIVAKLNLPENHPPITGFLGVPLVHDGAVIGMIGVANREGGYRPEDREIVEALAPTVLQVVLRKRAEEALQESQSMFNAFMDSNPAIAWMKDQEGRQVYMNRTWEKIYGFKKEEWLGTTRFVDEMLPEMAAELRAMEREILQSGNPVEYIETIDFGPEQGKRYHQCVKFLFQSVSGQKFTGGMALDITRQKQTEEMLRQSNRQKDEFLAVLSHELRNPLAAIYNSIAIMEQAAPQDAQAIRAREVIKRQIGQLARLVDDLLDISRITQNKVQLRRQLLDLNETVRRTVEDHRMLFENNGVELEVKLFPEPVMVSGDEARLSQVVGNLLLNAVKFTSRGDSARVTVERDHVSRQSLIRVSDTGIGIAPDMLARLFQPFMQADTSLDRTRSGLGLGLALSKGLVDLHGGAVEACSAGLGKGAEFIVRLPLDETGAGERRIVPAAVSRRSRRILIIDDNLDLARSLRDLLELCEHEVAVAYDGPEGLAKVREFQPEVVLCDIGLPGMDGYEVARALRSDAALQDIFLVALTGYAQAADELKAAEAGFERHLAKPVGIDALERVLAELA